MRRPTIRLAYPPGMQRRLDRRQLLALGAAVLAGSALVVYSQVYQSGADPWELFASWTVLALPFVLAARTPAL